MSTANQGMRRREAAASRDSWTPLAPGTALSSPASHYRHTSTGGSFTVDLWESILADETKEAWRQQAGSPGNSVSLDGRNASGGCAQPSAAFGTNTATATRAGGVEAAATAAPTEDANEPVVLCADVLHRKARCVMTFEKTADKLRIVRMATKPNGKNKKILYVPMHAVLNIETPEERDRRQRTHVANDDTTKMNLNNGKHPADRYLCNFAEADGAESHVYEHSRVNTIASSVSASMFHSNPGNASGSSYPSLGAAGGGLGSGTGSGGFGALRPLPSRYFIHYTKVEKSGTKKSIHTVEVTVSDDAQHLESAFVLAKAMLRRIYLNGPKKLIIFISPKSGTGQGKETFNNLVKPFLHFSRHSLHVIITRRAHDAEDYLADLDHYMDGNFVAVAVGGDGMMHEVVNGLHRRRQQLAEIIRNECRRRTEAEMKEKAEKVERENSDTDPNSLDQTVQGRDSLHNHTDSQSEDDESSAAMTQEKKKTRREHPTLSSRTNGETDSIDRRAAANEEAATKESAAEQPKHHLTMEDMRLNEQQLRTSGSPMVAHRASNQPAAGSNVDLSCFPTFAQATSPVSGVGSRSPGIAHGRGVSNVTPGSMPLIPERRRPCDVSFAEYVTNVFLSQGWDGLIPLTATVPTGSACGLAKSLDTLSVTQSAIALVHLSVVPQDVLDMRFAPNADLVEWHRKRMGSKRLKSAEEKFRKYQERTRAEMEAREERSAQTSLRGSTTQKPQRSNAEAQHSPHSPSARDTSRSANSENASSVRRNSALLPDAMATSCTSLNPAPPFLSDGSAVYEDPVSLSLGAPQMSSRVAFMSLSFGVANDIDRGSEHLRWMGNARFTVYGGYVLMKGITPYHATIRYLPWVDKKGHTVEKLHESDKIPDPSQFPRCTMRADCPHCLEYLPDEPLYNVPNRQRKVGGQAPSEAMTEEEQQRQERERQHRQRVKTAMREFRLPDKGVMKASTVANASDGAMLGEDEVDFDDDSLPWVVVRGEMYSLLLCSLRDVAQDMMMAPLSHVNDGAIDLIFCRVDERGGRREFFKFFAGLETGEHVNEWFTNYVKARAVEVKVDSGISMSDGEMMPLDSVRLTKLRSAVRMVRNDM